MRTGRAGGPKIRRVYAPCLTQETISSRTALFVGSHNVTVSLRCSLVGEWEGVGGSHGCGLRKSGKELIAQTAEYLTMNMISKFVARDVAKTCSYNSATSISFSPSPISDHPLVRPVLSPPRSDLLINLPLPFSVPSLS